MLPPWGSKFCQSNAKAYQDVPRARFSIRLSRLRLLILFLLFAPFCALLSRERHGRGLSRLLCSDQRRRGTSLVSGWLCSGAVLLERASALERGFSHSVRAHGPPRVCG